MSAAHKQLMLDVVRGKSVPRIPWVPRLDLWYRARQRAGTLPARYVTATLAEIVDDLGWGYHAVIPDFKNLRAPADEAHRALGIYNLAAMPDRTVFEEVDVRIETAGDRMTRYRTPKGNLSTVTVYDESMRQAGITITHVERFVFQSEADYAALCWLFDHARAEPNPDGYAAFAQRIGDRGFATAYVNSAGSPMHLIQRELMPVDVFFYEWNDRPEQVQRLATAIDRYWQQALAICADGAAEVVLLLGANYDAALQYPDFFARHIAPSLAAFAGQLHRRGKLLLTHTDGENTSLLEHYLAAQFDIADSICPSPMTQLTFGQVRDVFGDRITIMGGIPSVALLPASLNDRQFEKFLDEFFAQIGSGRRLILGISDTTPPDADFNRLRRVAQRVEEFGKPRNQV